MVIGPGVLTTRHMNLSQTTSADDRVENIGPFIMGHRYIFTEGNLNKLKSPPTKIGRV
jgi:hypothetical protein